MDNRDAAVDQVDIKHLEHLRQGYRGFLLQNPNYFGNLEGSAYAPQVTLAGNTYYERLGCIGYQPQTERLEAVVYVEQPGGYGGSLCGKGSQEYVRFYASWDEGHTWTDIGLSSFTAWDIPEGTEGRARLEYAVTRRIDFRRWRCLKPQIVLIRGILSWNAAPPPNAPNFPPVWGNVHDTHVLVEPLRFWKVHDLLEAVEVKPSAALIEALDPQVAFPVTPKPVPLDSLKALYGKEVPVHRYGFAHVAGLLAQGGATALSGASAPALLEQLGLDIPDLQQLFSPEDGNTTYEQLECIGYDPVDDSLVGVIRIKRASGFSGGPCTDGSREFVTFWADLNRNGTFETCLGTAEVRVYDIAQIPKDGLEFAVHLPANLIKYRRPCRQGPRLIPIRAVLSWAVPAPCATPNKPPVWGNHLDTLVQVYPGGVVDGSLAPLLSSVGGIVVSEIDANGLAQNAVAVTTGAYFNQAPFGGRINLAGKIVNGGASTRYRVMIRQHGVGSFAPLNLEPIGFSVDVVTWPPLIITGTPQHADPQGYYSYLDYASDHYVEGNILAVWQTGPAEHGFKFDLRVDVKDPGNPAVDIQSDVVVVEVDNKAPDVTLSFTSLAGDCAHFAENATFTGAFSATDPHFGGYSFEILPSAPANGVLPTPPSGASLYLGGVIADPGVASGTFSLATAGMKPCGYALILHATDRTNVNSGQTNNTIYTSVGFCLGNPPEG